MATSTLIQKLDAVTDPLVSGTVGSTVETMHRRQVETFIARETLLVGDWVTWDVAATADADVTLGVFKADANSVPVRPWAIGVVLGSDQTSGTLTAGSRVKVCISGVCDAFVGDAAGAGIALGSLLTSSNAAGVADLAASPLTRPVCAVLTEVVPAAAGVTLKRVVVYNSF